MAATFNKIQFISYIATKENTTSLAKTNGLKPAAHEINWQPIQELRQNIAAIQNTQDLTSDNRSQSQATPETANFRPSLTNVITLESTQLCKPLTNKTPHTL